ncbi:MAG: HEAT repeat domain-containing protein [Deltaproteobacteria bacterium]|nr:HEAT repeat domain-containing protein [Deltaproteobacteria bacterium]
MEREHWRDGGCLISWVATCLALAGTAEAAETRSSSTAGERREILRLLAALAAPEERTRAQGAREAGQAHLPLFVDPLRARLDDPAPDVQQAAAEALGELGVPRTAEDLEQVLADLGRKTRASEAPVRAAAIAALGRFPFPSVRTALTRLSRDRSASEADRALALRALAGGGAEARQRLEQWLNAAAEEARAARASPTLGVPESEARWGVPSGDLPILARDLLSPDAALHEGALLAITAWPRADESLPFLIRTLHHPVQRLRLTALAALSAVKIPAARAALRSALDDPHAEVRTAAAIALGDGADAESARALVEALHAETEPKTRAALIAALTEQVPGDLLGAAAEAPAGDRSLVRDLAPMIAPLADPRASALLIAWDLAGEPGPLADALARAIASRPEDETGPLLLSALAASPALSPARARCLMLLSGQRSEPLARTLLSLIGDGAGDEPTLRLLLTQDEAITRPGLVALLSSEQASTRALALSGIERWRGPDVTLGLVEVLGRDPRSKRAFELLLEQPEESRIDPLLGLLDQPDHDERRGDILAALAHVRDPRLAERVLKVTLEDPTLAPVSIALMSGQAPADALQGLGALAEAPSIDEAQRARAIRLLAELDPTAAEPTLRSLANDPSVDVRSAARNSLHRIDSIRYPAWDPYGRIPLLAEAGAFGATLMLVSAEIADANLSPAFTGGAGLVLGGATSWLLTRKEDVSLGDAGYFGTTGVWGTLAGWGLGGTLALSDRDTRWLTLAGEVLGVSAGALTLGSAEWGLSEVLLANFTSLEAIATTAALSSLTASKSFLERNGARYAGLLAGGLTTVPVALLARRLEVKDDFPLILAAMGHGAWLGGWAPGAFQRETPLGSEVLSGMVVGQGLGYLAGLALAQVTDISSTQALYSGAGGLIGAAIGGGLALSVSPWREARSEYALAEIGSIAGALTLGALAEHLRYDANDPWIIALAGAGGAIAAAQIEVRAQYPASDDREVAGNVLLGLGAGLSGGLLLSQLVDASDRTVIYSVVAGGLFGGLAQGASRLGGADVRVRSKLTGAGVLTGVALTAPLAERLSLGTPELGFAAISAAATTLWSLFLPAYWTEEHLTLPSDRVDAGALLGATGGLIGALAVSQALDLETRDLPLIGGGALAGTALGAGLGLLVPNLDRAPSIALLQGLGAAGLVTATAIAASGLGGEDWRTPGTLETSVWLMLHGAWHGGLVPFTWRESTPPEREVGGGVLFGAGLGAAAGFTVAQLLDRPLRGGELLEASVWSAAANVFGGGVGALLGDQRVAAGLMEGLGLAALGAGLALAPHTEWTPAQAPTLALGALTLGWLGGWLPVALYGTEARDGQYAGGVLAGTSLGLLGGAAYSQLVPQRSELELGVFAAGGSAIGGGLGLLAHGDDARSGATLLEVFGLGALAAGLSLTPFTHYDDGDFALIAAASALGAWHASFLPDLSSEAKIAPERSGGAGLVGGGAGLFAGVAAAQLLTVDPSDVLEATLLGEIAAGAALGLTLTLPGADRRSRVGAYELTALAGLGAASWLAPYTRFSREDYPLVALTAALGAAHGALLPALWSDASAESRSGGVLFGGATGALAGVAVSQVLDLSAADQAEAGLFAGAGDALGAGLSLFLDDTTEGAQAALVSGLGLGGYAGALALAGMTDYSAADRALLAYGTALGAWHGAWLGPVVDGPDPSERRAGGGALLGAGLGFLGAAAVAASTEVPVSAQLESIATWAYGSAIAGGFGLALSSLDAHAAAGLLELGGLAGSLGGLLLSEGAPFDEGDVALIGAALAIGAWHGSTVPVFDDVEAGGQRRAGGALLGAGALGLGAHLLTHARDYSTGDAGEVILGAALGNALGLGLGLMIPDSSTRLRLGLIDGFGLGATAAALAFAPSFAFERDTLIDASLFAGMGTVLGGVLPGLWNGPALSDAPGEQTAGGALLGAALGLGAAATLVAPLGLAPERRRGIALGALSGALSGGGLGLALSTDDRLAIGLFEGLTLAGSLLVGATASDIAPTPANIALGSAYVGYLSWHSVGLTLLLEGTNRQALGVTMASVGLGAATGMYLVPHLNLRLEQTLMLFAGAVWGTWIGGWGGAILKDHVETAGRQSTGLVMVSSVLGSDVGLLLTGLVLGGLLDVEPTRFAVINLCGLGGMMAGMLVAGFAREEPLKAGNVIGSLGGLALGALVTSFFDFSDGPSPYDEPEEAEERADAGSRAFPIRIEQWFPSATVEPTPNGERYLLTITGLWD